MFICVLEEEVSSLLKIITRLISLWFISLFFVEKTLYCDVLPYEHGNSSYSKYELNT